VGVWSGKNSNGDTGKMYQRHAEGALAETLLTAYLLRQGFYVLTPMAIHGPVDVAAISPKTGKAYFFDAKKEHIRNRVKEGYSPHRVHRKRKPLQKQLDVRIAYVNIKTGSVHIVPGIKELKENKPKK
jgi:hypothetical protein